ncbi:MAG: aminomethyl-transferring glycine dehydrogenase subunit GcvPB [Candidatus Thermoplasmatota archaeon]|nr:aminomethyl-transferring glycine dehydrogenase subunit GcvPB [Candidatus Thermoplasmatota archaeon]MCL5731239.1 aminomethyl-transferring glycine dehydrogenase subunit GcvPB [Candidatus Thermoplasmatota archaeon]
MSFHQARYPERLVKEYSSDNSSFIEYTEIPEWFPDSMRRGSLNLPQIAEYDVVRHFTRLSEMNYSVDTGVYPLGSCTMKFNPKYADRIASIQEFSEVHPLSGEDNMQGSLRIMYELQEMLKSISQMDEVSLQPPAGAQGEFTGIMIIRKFFEVNGEGSIRNEILIPDSAHGTNPASSAMGGFKTVEIPSNGDGMVDLGALESALSERTAALMITNPNTLGIFDSQISEIARMVHSAGGFLYYDGANFNAILGKTAPGKMGFDITHFNLHKTFATPHGGGGPGAGPVGVVKKLKDFLPVPIVRKNMERYFLDSSLKNTIGKVAGFYGNFGILLRAWAYIRRNGSDGLCEITERAVLNTNYLAGKLSQKYRIPYAKIKKHEVVVSSEGTGKRALDIAKYLLDQGLHPPTIYFPLIVKEALMIEMTETVSREDLDLYAESMLKALEVSESEISEMPRNTAVRRVDEVKAARDQILRW